MKAILGSKIALVLVVVVIICDTVYLTFWRHITSALSIFAVFLAMGIVSEMWTKTIIFLAPLLTYVLLIVDAAVKFALEDEVLRKDEAEKLEVVVKFGAILLMTIPTLYYNRKFLSSEHK